MIKTIIKRNGSEEEFQPSKINKWGEWAAKTLGSRVDWSSVVLDTVSVLPEKCRSIDLQKRLIKTCLEYNSWLYNRMAGRLYAALTYKELYDGEMPTVQELHHKLADLGLMRRLRYSDEEYQHVESIINHKLDLKASYYELHQVLKKYSIQNKTIKKQYESQQFVYMRMAMALAEDQPIERRMTDVEKFYEHLSHKRINAPTPNYVNLGTNHYGLASCCLYTVGDNIDSLAVGDHIAYKMTAMSAGIGSHLNTRSLGDPVRGGTIEHQGKLPYYRAIKAMVHANLQAGRGGAATVYYNGYDPEVNVITQLRNVRATEEKRIRGIDYNFGANKFLIRKAARGEQIFLFNSFMAPDLYNALYSGDQDEFERLYEKYENDDNFKKTYVDAREIVIKAWSEAYETGRAYLHWIDEMNRHTPHKDTIYQSNLCVEITEPTAPYYDMMDLYSSEDHGRGEIALCSLGAINVGAVDSEEQYEEVAYYCLLMIDRCIHIGEYAFPHLAVTAKARMNAGVGIVGAAYYMAKNKMKYSTQEGKNFFHEMAERHAYYCIRASLKLGKELGNAKWMHKTRWPEGWLPIDTYNRNVDKIVTVENKYDWESLRTEIIDNGGIRNSSLISHMPSESSSIASGTTNGLYPVRDLVLMKTDDNKVTDWAAPEGEKLRNHYELAWDIPTRDIIDDYAIVQKWTDQSISADLWRRLTVKGEKVDSTEFLSDYFYMTKVGMKTKYYQNSKTSDGTELTSDSDDSCAGGSCKL